MEFNILTLLANWLKLVCFNFPFAYFTQLFFIQPLVRVIFKTIFRKDIEQRNDNVEHTIPENEQEGKGRWDCPKVCVNLQTDVR